MGHSYNGWGTLIRSGRDKHYYHARKRGILPKATTCAICGYTYQEPCIGYHSEEYGPTAEDYLAACAPLCNHCHAMLHIRLTAPNCWKDYLTRLANGERFESPKHYVSHLSKCRHLPEIDFVPMPDKVSRYVKSLSCSEYIGIDKVATLLVKDVETNEVIEVPDWTIYGVQLEKLPAESRNMLSGSGVDVERFLSGGIHLPLKSDGSFIYKRLYLDNIFDWQNGQRE